MKEITTLAIDLAKRVFQLCGWICMVWRCCSGE